MPPICFYPGPSKVYPEVATYMQEAIASGILSIHHRSPEFAQIYTQITIEISAKLNVPPDYQVFFTSSATENWQIIAQSLRHLNFLHIFNGAFGRKWYETTQYTQASIGKKPHSIAFDYQDSCQNYLQSIVFSEVPQVICLTQNETSNGTQIPLHILKYVKEQFPQALIAIDATSSFGGIDFDFTPIDLLYASVQKCLGLPAGLAVMICSPRLLTFLAPPYKPNPHYNSLYNLWQNAQKKQTTHTPNILNIFLLQKVLTHIPPISQTAEKLQKRAKDLYAFFEINTPFLPLIHEETLRSITTLALHTKDYKVLQLVKQEAQKQNIILGNGYYTWKDTTFRVANFPQITDNEIALLKDFFANFAF